MTNKQQEDTPKPIRGPLVEDTTVVGGVDPKTGAPSIRPKTVDGKADESITATDPRERPQSRR